MEVVYSLDLNSKIDKNKITGIYGDIINLIDMKMDIKGITYDDNWTVKRFLLFLKKNKKERILSLFNYLNLNKEILKEKIRDLSNYNFKLVLLAYLLINNKNIIIFDNFEVGLNYKEQRDFINIMRNLKNDGKTIIVVSNNLEYMNKFVDNIIIFLDRKMVYEGKINEENISKVLVEQPEIFEFIEYANKRGAKLDYTLERDELLKDIFRSVGK